MSRILVIATGPLFAPDVRVFNGQALRTWHITKPLVEAGHEVDLIALVVGGLVPDEQKSAELQPAQRGDFEYRILTTTDDAEIDRVLQRTIDSKPYDCILSVNNHTAEHVCRLDTQLPIWVDLHGHVMGEAQAKAKVYNDDQYLKHYWRKQKIALRRGDRFSVVSFKQMFATLGELGTLGRLNRHTFSHPFCTVIPIAPQEDFLEQSNYPTMHHYRGKLFPENAFVVLWSGGFNTWTDTRTLAGALSLAMEQDSRIHFVATGGAIPGHDEITYPSFAEELAKTGFADRCHLLGWVETRELFALHRETDLGVNIDSLNYETIFGARNRLTNMMAAGLPILTTYGTEISEILDENKLAFTVPIGDVQAFADAIIRAARNPVDIRTMANKAKRYCIENFTYEPTTQAMLKWVANPTRAPDNEDKVSRAPEQKRLDLLALSSLEEDALRQDLVNIDELLRCKHDLGEIRKKRLYRLYKWLFG